MIAETEVGIKNEKTPKAKKLILAEEVVLGSEVKKDDLFRNEKDNSSGQERTGYEKRIIEHLKLWLETVKTNSAIVIIAVHGHGNFPSICTYIIVPKIGEGDGFRDSLCTYLKKEISGDSIKTLDVEKIPLIAVSGGQFASMSVSQRKMIFGDFIDPSREK